jgi:hypothetical protein
MEWTMISYNEKGDAVTFSGHDAVACYRVAVLMQSLSLLSKGIKPTRGLTMKKALLIAKEYTGQDYKRTEAERAKADLKVWLETMKSALPTETV